MPGRNTGTMTCDGGNCGGIFFFFFFFGFLRPPWSPFPSLRIVTRTESGIYPGDKVAVFLVRRQPIRFYLNQSHIKPSFPLASPYFFFSPSISNHRLFHPSAHSNDQIRYTPSNPKGEGKKRKRKTKTSRETRQKKCERERVRPQRSWERPPK